MPRKKPDLTPFYPSDKDRVDGLCARTPYFSEYSTNVIWSVKDRPENQRMVKCQDCGTIIPRNVPRIWLDAAYRHSAGHWCISCARTRLAETKKEFNDHKVRVESYVKAIDSMLENSEKIINDPRYIDALAMGKMISVIRGKKEKKYY